MSSIEKLASKIDKYTKDKKRKQKISEKHGFVVAAELFAGVFTGSAIGLVLDRYLGTAPWLFIICFIFGFLGGFLNLYKNMQK